MGALDEGPFQEELRLDELSGRGGSGPEPDSYHDVEEAVRVLLKGLGEDPEREGIKKTPLRVAKAFAHGTRGYKQNVLDIVLDALFPEAGLDTATGYSGGASGLVVVRDINLFSYCESCLLPFSVQCHVGYVPSAQRVVGLSKLSRVAEVFAKRLQEPQRLANEICSALQNSIKPAGVAVVLRCYHIQFPESFVTTKNPVKHCIDGWAQMSVCSSSGVLKQSSVNASFYNDFTALLKFRGVDIESGPHAQSWCPLKFLDVPLKQISYSMVSAVSSVLELIGEDPSRKELINTPHRYVHWLMNFKKSSCEPKQNGSTLIKPSSCNGHDQDKFRYELNVSFCSQCEHHLLPFYGVVHVAYFGDNIIEKSFVQSVVHFFGCKLQVQERLNRQIAEAIFSILDVGVMVVVEASHICMISRGIEKIGSSTATIAVMGKFATDTAAKAEFLQTISENTAYSR